MEYLSQLLHHMAGSLSIRPVGSYCRRRPRLPEGAQEMTHLVFIIASLATWRLSYAIVKENGPLMVFARLRARLAASQRRSGGLFDLISCIYCVSFWIGLVGALIVSSNVFEWVGYGLAFSAVAVLIERLTNAKV